MSKNYDIINDPVENTDPQSHHNALDWKHRNYIKDGFHRLYGTVPSLQQENAWKAQIIYKATQCKLFIWRKRKHTWHWLLQVVECSPGAKRGKEELILLFVDKSQSFLPHGSCKYSKIQVLICPSTVGKENVQVEANKCSKGNSFYTNLKDITTSAFHQSTDSQSQNLKIPGMGEIELRSVQPCVVARSKQQQQQQQRLSSLSYQFIASSLLDPSKPLKNFIFFLL